jgi:hypothetical protein
MSNFSLDFSNDEDFRPLAARMRPKEEEKEEEDTHSFSDFSTSELI